ncbi:Inherit from bactNOG: domain protein [Seminavis robusta]|uniref:Inherit from bactNOG: domain protein n=1 Tax=Seminavis robusta TaxID=568900 RepID=A0A9N8EXI9_9STRA|nr:Inherit from bactNOG: domain protein [Seminavis robusta]|eukprot:Sro1987_g309560.1 Inherit from bactNOG: domain protein (911) ;mRNA; f:8551-11283
MSSFSTSAKSMLMLLWLFVALTTAYVQNTATWTQHQLSNPASKGPPEPFPELFGFDPVGNPAVPLSPDPLVRYTWDKSTVNASQLQIYRVPQPVDIVITPPSAIQNDSIVDSVIIQMDWGVERAAWFEFVLSQSSLSSSNNLGKISGWHVEAGLSEFNSVYPGKKRKPVLYNNTYFRLETNKELYEGIRYTWIYLTKTDPANAQPLSLPSVSLVAKIKPIAYQGSFSSQDDRLTQTWYRGAYGVRLNMEAQEFNSILIERGDRVAIQGDGHPTMATALQAFGDAPVYDLVQTQLWKTNSGHVNGHHVVDDTIMSYPMYWVGSVLDWYWATGDQDGFAKLVPDVLSIVDARINDFLKDGLKIVWQGWDDRLGNGWCFHDNDPCNQEGHLTFAALVVKVVRDVYRALVHLPQFDKDAARYKTVHGNLVNRFRSTVPEYPDKLGVHSSANALAAGIATPADRDLWINSTLNDSVTICSWSTFNQYWILQGFAAADAMESAIESIHHCWGNMLDTGKGCFFELSSPDWTSFRKDGDRLPTTPSLCHPWASGVTAWMSTALAGIRPMMPGYAATLVAPYVSATHARVNATVPTPKGSIAVYAKWQEAKLGAAMATIHVENPQRLPELYVGFRKSVRKCHLQEVKGNGTIVKEAEAPWQAKDWTEAIAQNVVVLRATSYHTVSFQAAYVCEQQNQGASALRHGNYPASVSIDRKSQGDGLKEHGADGYILLGANTNGTNVENLPSYVSSVEIYSHGFEGSNPVDAAYVGSSDTDPAYLPFGDSRRLGWLGMDDDTYWNPGIVVDVNTTNFGKIAGGKEQSSVLISVHKDKDKAMRYKLSLYCVAKTEHEQFALRVMDLSTLNVIAPTKMIDKHSKGVWWSVEYDSSVRLRIMGIYGMHISAVAFSRSAPTISATTD